MSYHVIAASPQPTGVPDAAAWLIGGVLIAMAVLWTPARRRRRARAPWPTKRRKWPPYPYVIRRRPK